MPTGSYMWYFIVQSNWLMWNTDVDTDVVYNLGVTEVIFIHRTLMILQCIQNPEQPSCQTCVKSLMHRKSLTLNWSKHNNFERCIKYIFTKHACFHYTFHFWLIPHRIKQILSSFILYLREGAGVPSFTLDPISIDSGPVLWLRQNTADPEQPFA